MIRKYWIIVHKWDDATDEDVEKYPISKCLENNYVCMQYEYGIQDRSNRVTAHWNKFKEIQEGDVILLRGLNKIYAWGYAIKPRFDKNVERHLINCQNVINSNNHGKYRSDKYHGYVEFEDCSVFYENLEDGKNKWGQRIDIDKWYNYNNNYYEKGGKPLNNDNYAIARQIDQHKAEDIISKLSGKTFKFPEDKEVKMQKYITLLEQQKNIVLTGSPGTGKTFLANEIAGGMIAKNQTKPIEILKTVCNIPSFLAQYQANIENAKQLHTQFLELFPIESLQNLTPDKYCLGDPHNHRDNFCYWLEYKLEPLGNIKGHHNGTNGRGVNKHIIWKNGKNESPNHNEKMPLIQQALYELATKEIYTGELNYTYIWQLKVLYLYHPNKYFPIYSKGHMENICSLFGIELSDDHYQTNRNIAAFFHSQISEIDSLTIMHMIYSMFRKGKILSYGVNPEILSKFNLNNEYTGFVQFHPSFDYTDFVEGLRPKYHTNDEGEQELGFELKNGIFKDFCAKASKFPISEKFVFIIDEINRAELSKVFGELFFSIEPGYRGIKGKVQLQYSNLYVDSEEYDPFRDGFYIPENVYIIATMNDIDRSIEPFDFAMKRRFAWHEIKADETVENGMWIANKDTGEEFNWAKEAKNRMQHLNKLILTKFSSTYEIGGAYFLKLNDLQNKDNSIPKEELFEKLWEYHIAPVIKDYIRGDKSKKLEDFKKEFNNTSEYNENSKPNDESTDD